MNYKHLLSLPLWKYLGVGILCMAWLLGQACGNAQKAQAGEACLFNSACADDLLCIGGLCGTGKTTGADCTKDTECAGNLKCYDSKCAFGEQRTCTEDAQCGPGKKCYASKSQAGQFCAFGTAEGLPCGEDGDCTVGGQTGLKCAGGYCLKPSGAGTPCPDTESCLAPQVCSSKGTCVQPGQPGTGSVDATCASKEDCQSGLTCDANTKKCASGGSKGQPCADRAECAKGLLCSAEGKCADKGDPGTGAGGEACQANAQCQKGLICGSKGECTPRGAAKVDEGCAGNENCDEGLACVRDPEAKPPTPPGKCKTIGETGTTLGNEPCSKQEDCSFPLVCGFSGTCVAVRPFGGTTCESDDKITGGFRAFFEVPRKDQPVTEFYRLPFPNNIRLLDNGKVTLKGHANPGPLLGEDLIGKYISAIESEVKGFSTHPVVYMRFSQPVDFGTFKLDGPQPAMIYVNLTTGEALGRRVRYSGGRSNYICQNYLTIQPYTDVALQHGETYAVLITKVLTSTKGDKIQRDKDFDAVMGDAAPSDPDLKSAYDKYKPLRDYLRENGQKGTWPAPGDVVAATVFTTQDPDAQVANFRDVIDKRTEPKLSQLTLCDGNKESPCKGEGVVNSRECGKPDPRFHELHGVLKMPVFLQGKAPYKTEGGEIKYTDNKPVINEEIDVCVAITIPKGAKAPTEGWPIAIYGHGTGGNFRSHVVDGTANILSTIDTKNDKGEDTKVHYATIGIDQHLHGSRRGGDTTHPNFLFFNFSNPAASLNNQIQAAADQLSLIKLIQTYKLAAADSPIQEEISFNKANIAYVGHSQGGVVGPLFLAYTPDVKAAVLSGAGGYLVHSLLNKTQPINIADGIRALLGEVDKLGVDHPMLSLLQMYFDRSDASNYGHLLAKKPPTDIPPKHILQIYGLDDSFTPPKTMEILALTMGVQQVGPTETAIDGLSKGALDPPAQGNLTINGQKVTATFGQYRPAKEYDGHFVLFKHEDAKRHFAQFMGTLLADKDGIPSHVK